MTGRGFFFSSGYLYGIATKAYSRTKEAPSDLDTNQTDALVSIVFSAAALEAFIAEWVPMEKAIVSMGSGVRALVDVLDLIEESRGSVQLKYQLAKFVLSGEGYDRGKNPYQAFDLLFFIRNSLVHLRPEVVDFSPDVDEEAKIERRLKGQAFYPKLEPGAHMSWTARISTRAAAKWAINVAVDMTQSLTADPPDDLAKDLPTRAMMILRPRPFERIE